MGYGQIENTGISSALFPLEVQWYIEPKPWTESTPGQSKSGNIAEALTKLYFAQAVDSKTNSKQSPMLIIQIIPIQNSM